ncbi:MAG TPA: YggT family protein [Streptosporangiaceae bacterium]|nr:YggT family protein [Streptosporangiaceae bacterium]
MGILKIVLYYLLTIYLLILVGRMIISWIQTFARSWTPTGVVLLIAESIFTVTDPPLKFLRRYIPMLRIGTVAMDLSFMVLVLVVVILLDVVVPLI